KGTAYVTDLGMCGPIHGILGVEPDVVIEKFLTQLPTRFSVAKGPSILTGVVITLKNDGTAEGIVRLNFEKFS
ncbi:MAG TPA: metallophosphoesterase, partial [Firmicutes bacterium]|nr:metallophosphoesterase [Bacillota bacterium]